MIDLFEDELLAETQRAEFLNARAKLFAEQRKKQKAEAEAKAKAEAKAQARVAKKAAKAERKAKAKAKAFEIAKANALLNPYSSLAEATDAQLAVENESAEYSENFVKWVHIKVLQENLSTLMSIDKKEETILDQMETLQWVFAPDVVKGRRVQEIACSFHNCCLCDGTDPQLVRDRLLQVPVVRELIWKLRLTDQVKLPAKEKRVFYNGVATVEEDSYSN